MPAERTPRQTPRDAVVVREGINLANHDETLVTRARHSFSWYLEVAVVRNGVMLNNHNETVVVRGAEGLAGTNHNETVVVRARVS
jgi:hypothetical protein